MKIIISMLVLVTFVLSATGTLYGAWIIHPFLFGVVSFAWCIVFAYIFDEIGKRGK